MNSAVADQEDKILDRLLAAHGELMGGMDLAKCLGYRTARAFQHAATSALLPVKVFTVHGRRGRFARTQDVAEWLQRLGDQERQPICREQPTDRR